MTEIGYKQVGEHIETCRQEGFSPVYLVFGEPYLCRRAWSMLTGALLPDPAARSFSMETVDRAEGQSASEAVERAGTFSFFAGKKLVMFKAPDLFASVKNKPKRGEEGEGAGADDAAVLISAIERGFPKNHHLVLITGGADKRTRLYRAIASAGTVIDCSVPAGTRKAERDEQRNILKLLARETLAPHAKTIEPAAFEQVFELTGFDPQSFVNNLEKLALYAADRPSIHSRDVAAVLEKSREDPVYLFTAAVAERNADLSLYYMDSLLASGFHYMQVLSAIANLVRRLLAVKGFIRSRHGSAWQPGMPYDRFRQQVMPGVIEHDKALAAYVREIAAYLPGAEESRKAKPADELLIAKNPKNPYPVYQAFLQAGRFAEKELTDALEAVCRADLDLKSSGRSSRTVLESLIFDITGQAGGGGSGKIGQTLKSPHEH